MLGRQRRRGNPCPVMRGRFLQAVMSAMSFKGHPKLLKLVLEKAEEPEIMSLDSPGEKAEITSHLLCCEDHCPADCWRSGTSNHSAKGLELITEHLPRPITCLPSGILTGR